jgi:hypothetical protein
VRPLPSIKRKVLDVGIPVLHTHQFLNQKIRPEFFSRPVTHESRRIDNISQGRPTSAKVSITGFVSMGALLPTSARRKIDSFEMAGHPISSKFNPQLIPNSARFNTEISQETTRVNNLVNKLTRRPPSSGQNIRFNRQSTLKEEDEILSDISASSMNSMFEIDDE